MKNKKLKKSFYTRDSETVAKELIGKILCVKNKNNTIIRKRILETEAYGGKNDSASHAYRGKTIRNSPMYEEGGTIYIYMIYGLHFLLNVVTGKKDDPQAVLIRQVEDCKGPGLVCKNLNINKELNNNSFIENNLWIEDDKNTHFYKSTKRININYATNEDKNKLLRFILIKNHDIML